MKIWIGALWAAVGAIACMSSMGSEETLATEEQEANVCGFNTDPVTGVMCRYQYFATNEVATFVSSRPFKKPNGLDFVACTWSVPCSLTTTPESDSGARCHSVLGTGCPAGRTGPTTFVHEEQLTPEVPRDDVDTYCKAFPPLFTARESACFAAGYTVEQLEDRCCVARKPISTPGTPPPPVGGN